MKQQMIEACLPWAALAVAAIVAARVLVWLSGARLQPARLRSIHNCQSGSVQSLSFVLVLPFFVMIMMLIVQASQLMVGNIVMQYAAFAAARSASVWIPASVSIDESSNCISTRQEVTYNELGWKFEVEKSGDKYAKIRYAAVLACLPLGPSQDLGYQATGDSVAAQAALTKLYAGLDPGSSSNGRINSRLSSKLAYSAQNTDVDLIFWHRYRSGGFADRASVVEGRAPVYRPSQLSEARRDPPLDAHRPIYRRLNPGERPRLIGTEPIFEHNEVGWQDHITATVNYNLPLLPGPMRFFVPGERSVSTYDRQLINEANADDATRDFSGNVFIWPITGVATLVNEGQEPLILLRQEGF